jgi:glutamyl-tRNA reductase
MNFFVLGVNHKTAPIEVRERFAISEACLPEALGKLTSMSGVAEGMIVSTCNRVEIFARSEGDDCDLQKFVRDYFGFNPGEFEGYIFEHQQLEAVKHVFRVAASLDSMVVGESQILGQVKEAYATARALGAVNSQLDQLLTRAFAVAKKIHSQ